MSDHFWTAYVLRIRSIKDLVITMERRRLFRFCLSALLIALAVAEVSAQADRRKEQSQFGAEVAIRKPTEIPTDVLSILREDKRNQTCLKEGESPGNITSSWFLGSRVHLKADSDPDLIVSAKNSCLFGANLLPFWIFRQTPQGYDLILSVSGLGLDVLKTRTMGYRDVRASAATATSTQTVLFKFDGKEYRKQKPATVTSRR